MEYVRVNETVKIPLYGDLPRTPLCDGAYLSTDRGQDAPCCALCHSMRCAIYRVTGQLIPGEFVLEFVKRLPMASTACMISRCNQAEPAVFYYKGSSELVLQSYISAIKQQFLLRKEMRIVDREIEMIQVAYNHEKIPIIMPWHSTRLHGVELSDDGVRFNVDKTALTLVDLEKAYKAGRWMYVINFYQALNLLNVHNDDIPGQTKEKAAVWWSLI